MHTSPIGWADIAYVKKLAKHAKQTHPNLTLTQRQDHFARLHYGVRHFHELQQRHYSSMDAHLEPGENGVAYCRYCDFSFASTVPSDISDHRTRHSAYEEAQAAFGFRPEGYRRREEIKKQGYEWLNSPYQPSQIDGALSILLSHFYRSLAQAIVGKYWFRHPYFEGYVSASLPVAQFLPEDVRRRLIRQFGSMEDPLLEGQSYWPSDRTAKVHPSGTPIKDSLEASIAALAQHANEYAVLVQEYYEAEDEHYELGDPKRLYLTQEEIEEADNGVSWLDRLGGFFSIIDD